MWGCISETRCAPSVMNPPGWCRNLLLRQAGGTAVRFEHKAGLIQYQLAPDISK
jgi:hypothetical protein